MDDVESGGIERWVALGPLDVHACDDHVGICDVQGYERDDSTDCGTGE
jgi:hypothetical protein